MKLIIKSKNKVHGELYNLDHVDWSNPMSIGKYIQSAYAKTQYLNPEDNGMICLEVIIKPDMK